LSLVAGLFGCSGEYESRDLELDSPKAAAVKAMIADLRAAGVDGMETVLARDGAPDQLDMLKYALAPLVRADGAQLTGLTRYGDNVFAASITLTTVGQTSTLDMLLVEKDKTLLWAGRQ